MRRSIRRSFGFALAGNVCYALSQWLLLVVLAKFGTPTIVGQFSLALAVTTPVVLFTQLNLRGIQATDARGEFMFADYALLRGMTTIGALFVITAGSLWFGRADEAALIITVGFAKAIDSITDVILGHWQRSDRFDSVSAVMTINGVVSLTAMSLAFMASGRVTVAAAGFALGSVVALAAAVLIDRYGLEGRLRWTGGRLSQAIAIGKLALPLGPVMLLVAVNGSVPRYFLAFYEGNREVGNFAAGSDLLVAGTTLVGALGQSVSPRIAAAYAAGDSGEFGRLVKGFLLVVCAIGLAGVAVSAVAGRLLLSTKYSPEYGAAAPVLGIAMIGACVSFLASALGYVLTAIRRLSVQVPLFVFVVAVTTGASALLIPAFGLHGAAWACVAGAVAQMAGSAAVLRRSLNTLRGDR
jgi:O-antigen/teichoic acid export membrane protein